MKRQILTTEDVAIAGYIALDKPGAAKRLVQRVFARVEQLALFPQSVGKPRELHGTPYCHLVNRPLRIFYWVDAEKVYIVYVMRGERPFGLSNLVDHE